MDVNILLQQKINRTSNVGEIQELTPGDIGMFALTAR